MSLATFCDVVWVEIWDDCGPMGDHQQYRRIVTELFIEGKDAYDIFYETTEYDRKGKPHKKMKRLADQRSTASRGQQMISAQATLDAWRARAEELKAKQTAGESKS